MQVVLFLVELLDTCETMVLLQIVYLNCGGGWPQAWQAKTRDTTRKRPTPGILHQIRLYSKRGPSYLDKIANRPWAASYWRNEEKQGCTCGYGVHLPRSASCAPASRRTVAGTQLATRSFLSLITLVMFKEFWGLWLKLIIDAALGIWGQARFPFGIAWHQSRVTGMVSD
ncbi:hypothetical protein BKA66DRAFT_51460 [Pyrenochaeta sp. MPI-SDFR-AT-0127]|nr:hypothetical protein BKA66DRAFT_51460 [Pyrenochaeta sp. MPI-SDFR-AT-0127]